MTKAKELTAKAMIPIIAGAVGGIVATLQPQVFQAFCTAGF